MSSAPVSSGRRRALRAAALTGAVAAWPGIAVADAFTDWFRAVPLDHLKVVQGLLARGFDPNAIEPKRGESGLMLAIREGAMNVFRALLDAPDIDIHARAYNGDTALMIASFTGNLEATKALIQRGAQVHHAGWTPLHYAAASGHNALAKLLLDNGAELDARSPNNTTPLMMAAWRGHIYMVKLLHDAGADATLKNDHGMTAIDIARMYDYQDIAEGLAWRLKRAGKLPAR